MPALRVSEHFGNVPHLWNKSHGLVKLIKQFSVILFPPLYRNQDAELVKASWNQSYSESGLVGFSPEDNLVSVCKINYVESLWLV